MSRSLRSSECFLHQNARNNHIRLQSPPQAARQVRAAELQGIPVPQGAAESPGVPLPRAALDTGREHPP